MAQHRKKRKARTGHDRDVVREILKSVKEEDYDGPAHYILDEILISVEDPGGTLAWLAAYDLNPGVSSEAEILLFGALREPSVSDYIKELVGSGAKGVLLEALRNPAVPDDRKLMLSSLYRMAGGEISEAEMETFFEDFEAAMKQFGQQMIQQMSDKPQVVETTLEAMEMLVHNGNHLTCDVIDKAVGPYMAFLEKSPQAVAAIHGAVAAIAAEYELDTPILSAGIEALANQKNERVAWQLSELGRWPGMGTVGEKAALAAAHMANTGIDPSYHFLPEFSHGFVSMIDGAGSRSMTLFFRTPEGGMDALIMILNDQVGMKDTWCTFDDSENIESVIHERVDDISYAPCTLELARDLAADTWALHEQQNRPFPGRFFIYRIYLGQHPIEPRRRTPNLGAYMLETMIPSPKLVQRSDELLDYGPYGGLVFTSDEAYQFVSAHAPKRGKPRLSAKALDAFIREIVPLEISLLLDRMAVNLELEAIAGRANQTMNQMAAKTWLAISERACPYHEIPFLYHLADLSSQEISQNLRMGFENQQQVNQAVMAMDDGMRDYFDEIDDEWQ